jgi:hypothetical protein
MTDKDVSQDPASLGIDATSPPETGKEPVCVNCRSNSKTNTEGLPLDGLQIHYLLPLLTEM